MYKILKNVISMDEDSNSEIEQILRNKKSIDPVKEALRISFIYLVAGTFWILTSDNIVGKIIQDIGLYKYVQTYKGWFYVIMTTIMLYYIIVKRMVLFKKAIRQIRSAYEELTSVEEELRSQFDELSANRDALYESEQRYELAVEGSRDGIWDWDIKNNTYYFSIIWNDSMGYEKGDLAVGIDTLLDIMHPDDREQSRNKIYEYRDSMKEDYESTYRLRTKNGEYRWILSRGKGIRDNDGNLLRIAGSHTDITGQKEMEKKLHLMAYYDELTGLANRNMFEIDMERLIGYHDKSDTKFALVYMDIDNFKHINDTFGHVSGDKLLVYISSILKQHMEEGDTAIRLSGDEFAILIGSAEEYEDIEERLKGLIQYLRKPWVVEGYEFFISFSMGVAVYPEHGDNMTDLLKNADTAMFSVKENGKDSYCFYDGSMQEKTLNYIDMTNSLRRAIEDEEFILHYQPIEDMDTGDLVGVEALVRWLHPKKGFIPPMKFIPLAEETGQICKIDRWVIKNAVSMKKRWAQMGHEGIVMSINISGKSLSNKDIVRELMQITEKEGIYAGGIQLEITETAVMKNIATSIDILEKIRKQGVKIALDDFGSGYSSLNYLKNLPIDVVKIDRGFVKNIEDESENEFILDMVIKLAHELGKKVIAEGVETKWQHDFLRETGCDTAQGYYLSRPVEAIEIEKMMS